MENNQSPVYLTYALLQLASETMFGRDHSETPGLTNSGPINELLLRIPGNGHSSRFTVGQAAQFAAEWTVVEHKANTATGFSGTLFRYLGDDDEKRGLTKGQLVISFRSTEFIEDSARDSQATNTLELKEFGFAFGQIADMEQWYADLKLKYASEFSSAHDQVDVTGYSLGGSLATAFNLLHASNIDSEIGRTFTFNGAGVGALRSNVLGTVTLGDVIANFVDWRDHGNLDLFTKTDAAIKYQELLGRYGSSSTDPITAAGAQADAIAIGGLLSNWNMLDLDRYGQFVLLKTALERIASIAAEAERAPGVPSGDGATPASVQGLDKIAGLGLDYQLAILRAQEFTTGFRSNVILSGIDGYFGRNTTYGVPRPIFDMYGAAPPSAVSNSQYHYGRPVPIIIEDQPLFRGNVGLEVVNATLKAGEAKLLVPNYVQNDFGDTHSLVLIVDSLSIQVMLAKLQPGIAQDGLNDILAAGSNAKAQSILGTQGAAEGDTLDNVLTGVANVLGVSKQGNWIELNPDMRGGHWADIDGKDGFTGRKEFHANLDTLTTSSAFQSIAGKVTVQPSGGSLGARARNDFSALASLITLSPVTLMATDAANQALLDTVLQGAWGNVYADWLVDKGLTTSGSPTGRQTFSDKWIGDRATMLDWLVLRNEKNLSGTLTPAITGRTIREAIKFESRKNDGTVQQQVLVGAADQLNQRKQVVFGGSAADTLDGFGRADDLYGGAGNDKLDGQGGADHLEGGDGNDILIGGVGSDALLGGKGLDTYIFSKSELRERVIDVITDFDGLGQLQIAESVDAQGVAVGAKNLVLTGWTAAPRPHLSDPQRYTNAGFTLTAIGPNQWTLSGIALPTEATLHLDDDKTLRINFGRAGGEIQIKDWDEKELGIELKPYIAPNALDAAVQIAEMRDLALLEIVAGIDLYNIPTGDQSFLRAKLTGAPTSPGTAERLTPAQADYVLSHYEILNQYGNDGAGFSATIFRRKPTFDASGNPLEDPNPYVLAFRGNDLEPDRVGGLAKDGGLGAMREINRYGFAWGQLDAMERFWGGLKSGKVMNRAGQWIQLQNSAGIVGSQATVIGTGVGAHLASAFTLLHPEAVSQGIGFDGPGIGGMASGGASRPITAEELRSKLSLFITLMAYRGLPLGSSYAQTFQEAGVYDQWVLAMEADRPSEAYDMTTNYWQYLGTPYGSQGLGAITAFEPTQGWENTWDGANIYHSQLYQFIAQWLGRDTVGAGQGSLTPNPGDGVGDQQLTAAWNALMATGAINPVTGQPDPSKLQWAGLPMNGAAGTKFTHWSLQTDRIDPGALLSGQGYGGTEQRLWTEDPLGVDTPADRATLDQISYDRGWGNNTASRPLGSAGNMTRLVDSFDLAALFQAIDDTVTLQTFSNIQRGVSRQSQLHAWPVMPNGKMTLDDEIESRDVDTLERSVNALARLLLGTDPKLQAGVGAAGHLNATARAAWSEQVRLIGEKVQALQEDGAELSVLDLTLLTADQIAGLAADDSNEGQAVRYALKYALPFAIVDDTGKAYAGIADPEIKLAPEDGPGSLAEVWVQDRSAFLVGLITARTHNLTTDQMKLLPDVFNTTAGWETRRWTFSDVDEKTNFTFAPPGWSAAQLAALPESITRFGSRDASNPDVLAGAAGGDWLYGQEGADVLSGLGGDDLLEGGAGTDALFGGAGPDELTGATGSDTLDGGAGEDRFYFERGDGADTLFDRDTAKQHNTLVFGAGITKEDLVFVRGTDSVTIQLRSGGQATADSVTLQNFHRFNLDGKTVVTQFVEFDDDTQQDLRVLLNRAPQASGTVAAVAATQFQAFSYTLPSTLFTDADSDDKLSWQMAFGDENAEAFGLSFNAATRTLHGRPLLSGPQTLTVTVTDRVGATAQTTLTLNVAAAPGEPIPLEENEPPQATQELVTIEGRAGTTGSHTLSPTLFADPTAGDALFLQARLADGSPLPDWIGFDPGTGAFTASPDADAEGSLEITVTATDLGGYYATVAVMLNVQAALGPRVGEDIETQEALEDEGFGFFVPETAFDAQGAELTLSATLADGSALPGWLSFDATQRRFQGLASDATAVPLTIALSATDAQGHAATQYFDLTVVPQNDAPALKAPLAPPPATQGLAYSWGLASDAFTDAESGSAVAVDIRRADGSALPAWLSFNPLTRTLSGKPGADDVGPLALTVLASDPQGVSSATAVTLTVANVNDLPVLSKPLVDATTDEDAPFVYEIPGNSFTDADRETLNVMVTRANGEALPAWLHYEAPLAGATHLGRLVGTPDNAAVGPLELLVTVQDAAGATASDRLVVTVLNTNDAPTAGAALQPAAVVAYAPLDISLSGAAFVEVDAGEVLQWGLRKADGSALPAWMKLDPATGRLTGRAVNADAGTLNLVATLTDAAGASASQPFVLNIATGTVVNSTPTAPAPLGTWHALAGEAVEWQLMEGSFVDADAFDALSYSATLASGQPLPSWLSFDPVQRRFFGLAPAEGGGVQALRITATDRDGAALSQTLELSVEAIASVQTGTAGNDTLPGTAGNDRMDGGMGADSLYGNTGHDVLVGGDGNDTLAAGDGDDRLDGSAGHDLLMAGAGDDLVRGGDGEDWLWGTDGNDMLEGGPGADVLFGGTGSDTYVFRRGDGIDQVRNTAGYAPEADASTSVDTLRLIGFRPDEAKVTRNQNMLTIDLGGGDTVHLTDYFFGNNVANAGSVDAIRFDDGTSWSPADIERMVYRSTAGKDQLWGSNDRNDLMSGGGEKDYLWGLQGQDTLFGDTGNDYLSGDEGNDSLEGGDGIDYLAGGAGNDVLRGGAGDDGTASGFSSSNNGGGLDGDTGDDDLDGGAGNDWLDGGQGSDVYHFGRGYGHDWVVNYDAWNGKTDKATPDERDTLLFNADVQPSNVIVRRNGGTLELQIAGTSDQVGLLQYFAFDTTVNDRHVDDIRFADGTVWDAATIRGMVLRVTDGADWIQGYADANDVVAGGAGNDTLEGRAGDDRLSGDAGRDTLYGEAGSDTLSGGADDDYLDGAADDDSLTGGDGADLIWGRDGNDLLEGGAGDDGDRLFYPFQIGDTDWSMPKGGLYGGAGNDTLDGGAGNDILADGKGVDTYRFGRGDGRDDIYNYDYWSGGSNKTAPNETDTLEFKPGVVPSDVLVSRQGDNLILSIQGTADQVRVVRYFDRGSTDNDYKVDRIVFADGTAWTDQDVLAKLHGNGAHAPTRNGAMQDLVATEDEPVTLALPASLFTDADGDPLKYRVLLAGGQALPSWLSYLPPTNGQGPGSLRVEAMNANVGALALEFVAIDRVGLRSSAPFVLTVANKNDVPTLAQALTPLALVEDQAFSLTLPAATFSDVDTGDTLSWSVELSGGSALPAWLQFDAATRTLSGTPVNAAVGTLDLVVRVTDTAGVAATAPLSFSISGANDAPQAGPAVPPLAATAYQVFALPLPANAVVDPDQGEALGYRMTLANGEALPSWLKFDAATLTLHGRAVNADVGPVNLQLIGKDTAGLEAAVPIVLNVVTGTVINAAPVADALPNRATNTLAPFFFRLPIGGFRETDAFDAVRLSAVQADGSALPSWLVFDAHLGSFSGTAPGSATGLNLAVTATDRDGAQTVRTFTLDVGTTALRRDGTPGNDALAGADGNDVLVGADGRDHIPAGLGNDVLIGGDGDDYLEGGAGHDTVMGGAGAESANGGDGDDELLGEAGNDTLQGANGNDTLDGGAGDDWLSGGPGDDVYIWGRGDGSDRLDNRDNGAPALGVDALHFKPGTRPEDLVFRRYGDLDLTITVRDTGETLTVPDFFAGNVMTSAARLDHLRFADGTRWAQDEILRAVSVAEGGSQLLLGVNDRPNTLRGSFGEDELRGGRLADVMDGGAGRDRLYAGSGNDTLLGGAGADGGFMIGSNGWAITFGLYGDDGDDLLDGGPGDDQLEGGAGNDTYVFGRGSGHDNIDNTRGVYVQPSVLDIDTLQFGPGIALSDLHFRRDSIQLEVTINGTQDSVLLQYQFEGNMVHSAHGVDRFVLSDGTEIPLETIVTQIDPNFDQMRDLTSLVDQMGFEDHADTLVGNAGKPDRLWGYGGNDALDGGDGADYLYGDSGSDTLVGGDGPDHLDGGSGNDTLLGGAGDEGAWADGTTGGLFGGDGDDLLHAGPGTDYLRGGRGSDTYRFERGDGIDRIATWDQWRSIPEFTPGDRDVLEFGAGISPADVVASKDRDNLVLVLKNTADQVFVYDQFRVDAVANGIGLAEIRFADGSIWTPEQLISLVQQLSAAGDMYVGFENRGDVVDGGAGDDRLYGAAGDDSLSGGDADDRVEGGAGNDSLLGGAGDDGGSFGAGMFNDPYRIGGLFGGDGDDTLDGGAGNDYLEGGAGADVYRFASGGGTDYIGDFNAAATGGDVVVLGAPINADNLTVSRTGSTLILRLPGAEELRLSGYFDAAPRFDPAATVVRFVDGTVITVGDIAQRSVTPTEADDVLIFGGDSNRAINAEAGNDRIETQGGSDRLLGGLGNDMIFSGAGADEVDGDAGDDRLYLGDGADLARGGDGRDLIMGDPGDDLIDAGPGNDAYDWTSLNLLVGGAYGGDGKDTINGGAGNDLLFGDAGDDVLLGGDGDDGGQGWFRLGNISDGASVNYAPGLFGGAGNDTLEGGLGKDNLSGGPGNDTYVFGRGDGQDTILDNYHWMPDLDGAEKAAGEHDELVFKEGVRPQDVSALRISSDLLLRINDSGDEIRIGSYFAGDRTDHRYRFDTIRFADGTQWDAATLAAKVSIGTEGRDYLYGVVGSGVLQGLGGNDVLGTGLTSTTLSFTLDGGTGDDMIFGSGGNDTLLGGDGNDTLNGDAGNDLLDGGAGNDGLSTGTGNDVVVFGRGYGTDSVSAHQTGPQDTVVIRLQAGLSPANMSVRRSSSALELRVSDSTDKLVLTNVVSGNTINDWIDRIEFADGTVWTPADLAQKLGQGSAGNDTLYGLTANDTLDGGAGNDLMFGDAGNDSMTGGAGDDQLSGDSGNDWLDGGTGNDTLSGQAGNDVYVFGRGSGNDMIKVWENGSTDADVVRFASDILPSGVEVRRYSSYDVLLVVKNTADSLRLANAFNGNQVLVGNLPVVEFADGTRWDAALLTSMIAQGTESADALQGTPGADHLMGRGGNDSLYGGDGNDWLEGGEGIDYINGDAGNDTVDGGIGADSVYGGPGNDTLIGGDGADILDAGEGADRLEGGLENDTLWGRTGDDTLVGGDGSDGLNGAEGNDTLEGSAGNDNVYGGAGNDTYLFGVGDGQDDLHWDSGTTAGETNTLQFKDGVLPSQVVVTRVGSTANAQFSIIGTSDTVTAFDFFRDNSPANPYNVVQQVKFADGTTWDMAAIVAKISGGTAGNDTLIGTTGPDTLDGLAGNDTLYGRDGNDLLSGGTDADSLVGEGGADTLDGGAGNDLLDGGLGNDTFTFGKGDGQDVIGYSVATTGQVNTLQFKPGVLPSEVMLKQASPYERLELSIAGTSDTVFIDYFFRDNDPGNPYNGLQQMVFADGTVWDLATIVAKVFAGTPNNDALVGTNSADTMGGAEGNDTISARNGDDVLFGGDGADSLMGDAGADTLEGGSGNDSLVGGSGNDTFVFGRGDGQDVIGYGNATTGEVNTLQFKPGVLPSEVTVRQVSPYDRIEIAIAGTEDKVLVDYFFRDSDPANAYNGLQRVVFADGTSWDLAAIVGKAFAGTNGADSITGSTGADVINGLDGADTLLGRAGNDTLDGGAGADLLDGGTGNNVYLFGKGDGQDTVSAVGDATAGKLNTVQFKAGVSPSEVVAKRVYDNGQESLELSIIGTTDKLTVRYFFNSDNPDNTSNPVQQVKFADGTTWDINAIKAQAFAGTGGADSIMGTTLADVINGLAGADTLSGRAGDDMLVGGADNDSLLGEAGGDTLDGGAGNDVLDGGTGNNVYLFGRGDGQDIINGYGDATVGRLSTVQFKAGVSPAEVLAKRLYDGGYESLELSIAGTSDKITVRYFFLGSNPSNTSNPVQQVKFADGTTWDLAALAARVLNGSSGADSLVGTAYADAILGLDGNDTLYGRDGDDVLEGGSGVDSLFGENGVDSLDGGAGNDQLNGGLGNNVYLFGKGDGQDVIASVNDATAGKLNVLQFKGGIVVSEVSGVRMGTSLVLSIAGTSDKVTIQEFFASESPGNPLNPVQQARFADGTVLNLAALAALGTSSGSETDTTPLNLTGTSGDDSLFGNAGPDTLRGGSGNDAIAGRGGADSLYGENGNDTLDGGSGNDTLDGNLGNNTYLFGKGDGQDTVNNFGDATAGKLNTVQFKAGVSPSEVVAKRLYDGGMESLELSITGTTDKLTVKYFFGADNPANTNNPVQQVQFADGTTWDINAIKALVFAGTSGADSIAGTTLADAINGLAGADTLYGRAGDDTLSGGADNDTLYGEAGNDTLEGGTGNDTLDGSVGNNTYLFGKGDGQDTVNAFGDATAGKLNTVQFKAGVSPSEVVAKRIYDNGMESLELSITGTTDKLTVRYFFGADNPANTSNPVQQVQFADGTTWDINAIKALVFAGTSGADSIAGTTLADSINGLAGADTLYGRTGDDTLSGGADSDTLYGEAGNDTLEGGAGNDTLVGGTGADTYRFEAGYGVDTIQESDSTAGVVDVVQFAGSTPILQTDVTFVHVGNNLEARLNGTSDKLVLQSWYSGAAYHVEAFRFTDGSVLTDSQVQGMVSAMAAFAPQDMAAGVDACHGRPNTGWPIQLALGLVTP